MEGIKKIENIDVKTTSLQSFFDELPEGQSETHRITREALDQLIEQGVSVEELCDAFVQRGFLLHGTGMAELNILEPRQANDEGGFEENLKNAVYATDDSRIPIFMALRSGVSGMSHYSITSSKHEDGLYTEEAHFSVTSKFPSDKVGSVYVLPSETFEVAGSDRQFVSSVPVVPLFELPVKLQDFQYPVEEYKE